MAGNNSGLSSRLFGELGNKLKMASNRSLVDANKQLRVELAFARREIVQLQNETVDLKRRIVELETASDEERIEIVVQRRLQQRVQHLKSIANRTVQYMRKATADFDGAANRLDHALNFDDDATGSGECSRSTSRPMSEIGDENAGRRTQRTSVLEAVEEDIFGEMDGDGEEIFVERLSDKRPITPMSEDIFKRFLQLSNSARKPHRSSRRQTFFVKKELDEFDEFENDAGPSGTNQVSPVPTEDQVSPITTVNLEAPSIATVPVGAFFEHKTPQAAPLASSAKFHRPRSVINRRVSKSATATSARKRRGVSAVDTPKRHRRSSGSSRKSQANTSKPQVTPNSTLSMSMLNSTGVSENSRRPRRAAAAKIASFKEPSLVKKMRNPNVD